MLLSTCILHFPRFNWIVVGPVVWVCLCYAIVYHSSTATTMADNLRFMYPSRTQNNRKMENDDELIVFQRHVQTYTHTQYIKWAKKRESVYRIYSSKMCHMCMKFDWEMDKGAWQCQSGKKLGHHISKWKQIAEYRK